MSDIHQAKADVGSILRYAFTEMLNNAIDHSDGTSATVSMWRSDGVIAFEIADDGIGVFEHVRRKLNLADDLVVIQELSKGKRTTDPARHTGEGIFFTSKLVDIFELEGGETRWVVDNLRRDYAIGSIPPLQGTRVRCHIRLDSDRDLKEVFDRYADASTYEFSKSVVDVRLFREGDAFVSRSEARRIANRLEGFKEVKIDFSGVTEVGQAFADELFRVWARDHPGTKLVPVNMVSNVAAMIRRAETSRNGSPAAPG